MLFLFLSVEENFPGGGLILNL